jgi:hypothetical protein
MAPTSGTNKTFDGLLALRRIKSERGSGASPASGLPSRSRFLQVKKPHGVPARSWNGNQEPQFPWPGLALAAITP